MPLYVVRVGGKESSSQELAFKRAYFWKAIICIYIHIFIFNKCFTLFVRYLFKIILRGSYFIVLFYQVICFEFVLINRYLKWWKVFISSGDFEYRLFKCFLFFLLLTMSDSSTTNPGKYSAIGRFRVTTEKTSPNQELTQSKSGATKTAPVIKGTRKVHHHHHHHHSVKKLFGYGMTLSYPEPTIQEETSPNESEVQE